MKYKHLHTNFLKFLKEKYNAKIQELPEEETNVSDKEVIAEFDKIMGYGEEENDEVQDDEEPTENDETIDDLIKEYRSLQKKYKIKTNGNIRNKRK
ncbi:hypothetical protein [Flavobacterium gilvum]|uniref:Uncharacterized protein n=1 Tax=Flavobacterium gilvum TaxID=1492737 RepID=A0AAC9I4V8_9FLAO|nr:hypothetical protein [Flavobacterium gilvum]AOW10145.1 hypothetical protein EM308_11880 [Flavobacterium gilvum]KFC58615.1 hypothetical protein FEM08_26090 [Flavobacterium gilvum]